MSNRTLGACLLLAVCHYVFPTQKLFEASELLAGASLEEGIGGGGWFTDFCRENVFYQRICFVFFSYVTVTRK